MPRSVKSNAPAEPSVDGEGMPFEAALAELERLVEGMEAGELTLEQSLAAHRRGLELARLCQNTLRQAEQQVRVLEEEMLKTLPGRRREASDTDDD